MIMNSRQPAADEAEALRPTERTSKVGDLGRGSHEQTQGGAAPKDLPGDEPAPSGR
jgi:hypothetical protein